MLAIVAALAPVSTAHAISVTWTTTGSDSTDPGSAGLAGDVGNIKTFNSTSPTGYVLQAAAFSMPYPSSPATVYTTPLQSAYLGAYGGGLGVGNAIQSASSETSSPGHAVDNVGAYDMVIFKFPTNTYDPTSVRINPYCSGSGCTGDTDVTFFVGGQLSDFGTVANPFSGFAGKTLNQITALGTWYQHDDTGNGSTRTVLLNPNNNTELGQYLIVLARITDTSDRDDYFKIDQVKGDPVVPEPSTFLLVGMGLVALVSWKCLVPHRGCGSGHAHHRLPIQKVQPKNAVPGQIDRLSAVAQASASGSESTVLTLNQYAPMSFALTSDAR